MSFFWVGHFEFFFQKKLIFFCFIPMKISHKLYDRMDGTQFWYFLWFPANSLLYVILRYTVYFTVIGRKFKFQAQDSFLEYFFLRFGDLKNESRFLKKATFRRKGKSEFFNKIFDCWSVCTRGTRAGFAWPLVCYLESTCSRREIEIRYLLVHSVSFYKNWNNKKLIIK